MCVVICGCVSMSQRTYIESLGVLTYRQCVSALIMRSIIMRWTWSVHQVVVPVSARLTFLSGFRSEKLIHVDCVIEASLIHCNPSLKLLTNQYCACYHISRSNQNAVLARLNENLVSMIINEYWSLGQWELRLLSHK